MDTNHVVADYGFTGKERDAETGLDYFGARYLSSAQGRFMSPDEPLADQHAENPQSWNLYSYVRNNPLIFSDPTGQDCVYTSNQSNSSVTVSWERGNCTQEGGAYVNGTLDEKSFKYNGSSLDFGYTDANGAPGVFSKNLATSDDQMSTFGAGVVKQLGKNANSTNDLMATVMTPGPLFVASFLAVTGAEVAYEAYGAYRAAQIAKALLALKAAQAALKALPPDQYALLQKWLGPIKAGSPITPPPPGLTADAMQRYLDVAEAYIATGGSGAAIQVSRIAALKAALGK